MVAHFSGTTLDAQIRYATGVKEILKRFFAGEEQERINVICIDGDYASKAYGEREKLAKRLQA
ncbi:MAG: formate dehydrogenase (NAD+) [Cyphobasidiales sp. Tagirdzhanova-0007]|nr:MAG: formate dehydrogenase (NAD+) [Cyphobasidiales sp. Tagirdzhanova-0007]